MPIRISFPVVLVFSLVLGVMAMLMTRNEFARYRTQIEEQRAIAAQVVPTRDVYVVTRQLRYGEQLTPKDVRAQRWPVEAIPQGVFFADANDLFPSGGPEFRSILRVMEAGEPVLAVKVTEPGGEAGVSARLAAGMRAFAIQVDVQTGVSGLLRPGDRVDVYWTGQNAGNTGTVTRLIDAGLQIVAVDQSADIETARTAVARTITVQATPKQVASLTQAQATGRLSLSLVGGQDDSVASAVDVDQRAIAGVVEVKPVAPVETRNCTITTRRAGEKAQETPVVCRN